MPVENNIRPDPQRYLPLDQKNHQINENDGLLSDHMSTFADENNLSKQEKKQLTTRVFNKKISEQNNIELCSYLLNEFIDLETNEQKELSNYGINDEANLGSKNKEILSDLENNHDLLFNPLYMFKGDSTKAQKMYIEKKEFIEEYNNLVKETNIRIDNLKTLDPTENLVRKVQLKKEISQLRQRINLFELQAKGLNMYKIENGNFQIIPITTLITQKSIDYTEEKIQLVKVSKNTSGSRKVFVPRENLRGLGGILKQNEFNDYVCSVEFPDGTIEICAVEEMSEEEYQNSSDLLIEYFVFVAIDSELAVIEQKLLFKTKNKDTVTYDNIFKHSRISLYNPSYSSFQPISTKTILQLLKNIIERQNYVRNMLKKHRFENEALQKKKEKQKLLYEQEKNQEQQFRYIQFLNEQYDNQLYDQRKSTDKMQLDNSKIKKDDINF